MPTPLLQVMLSAAARIDESIFSISRKSAIITDYMASVNLCFSNVKLYIERVQGLENTIGEVISAMVEKYDVDDNKNDPESYMRDMLTQIYSSIMRDNAVMANAMQVLNDGSQYNPNYTNTLISYIPGIATIDVHQKPLIERTSIFDVCEDFDDFMQPFNRFSRDPAIGNGQYGILPYVFPFTVYSDANDPIYNPGYIESIYSATRYFYEYIKLRQQFMSNIHRHVEASITEEMTSKTKQITTHVYDALIDIPYHYNNTELMYLPPFKAIPNDNTDYR